VRNLLFLALTLLLVLTAWLVFGQYTRAAALLVHFAELDGWPAAIARLHERPVSERMLRVPTRDGERDARVYIPEGRMRRMVVLVAGVHPSGIDEPRLVHFARSLGAVGLGVITPDLPRLFHFDVTPDATDAIEDVVSWVRQHQATLGPGASGLGAPGLIGISFSGGLSVVAAGRPSVRDHLAFVLSLGGHGDLLRTLDVLGGGVLGETPDVEADVFGLAIIVANVADRVVPPDQVAPLREWAITFLEAAHLPFEEDARRRQLFRRADELGAALPEPAATLMRYAREENVAALRPLLVEEVRQRAGQPALSPEHSPPPSAPVYLLHGDEDPVIPPSESLHLARHLDPHTEVRLLVTPVLSHADLEEGLAIGEARTLVAFMASILRR
jgi:pimeloyl-ACP methyl ester carboxylesterase